MSLPPSARITSLPAVPRQHVRPAASRPGSRLHRRSVVACVSPRSGEHQPSAHHRHDNRNPDQPAPATTDWRLHSQTPTAKINRATSLHLNGVGCRNRDDVRAVLNSVGVSSTVTSARRSPPFACPLRIPGTPRRELTIVLALLQTLCSRRSRAKPDAYGARGEVGGSNLAR